jgi:hypothetical protein
MWSGLLVRHECETDAVERCPCQKPDVVRDQWPVHGDDE